jgi:hypothetical protein
MDLTLRDQSGRIEEVAGPAANQLGRMAPLALDAPACAAANCRQT